MQVIQVQSHLATRGIDHQRPKRKSSRPFFEWILPISSPEIGCQKIPRNQKTKTELQNEKLINEDVDIYIWTHNTNFSGHWWRHFKIFTFKIGQELAKGSTIF